MSEIKKLKAPARYPVVVEDGREYELLPGESVSYPSATNVYGSLTHNFRRVKEVIARKYKVKSTIISRIGDPIMYRVFYLDRDGLVLTDMLYMPKPYNNDPPVGELVVGDLYDTPNLFIVDYPGRENDHGI